MLSYIFAGTYSMTLWILLFGAAGLFFHEKIRRTGEYRYVLLGALYYYAALIFFNLFSDPFYLVD